MAALKSVAMVVGLSAIALSQATVPQFYIQYAFPGDAKPRKIGPVVIDPPLSFKTDSAGIPHLGIDPAALGVKVLLNDTLVGTTGALKIVPGPGIIVTAIKNQDASVTVQVSVDGGCTFDANRNSVCPGSVTIPNGGVPPNILAPPQ